MKSKAYRSYQRVRIATSDPTKIIVMLYEGSLRNLYQAIEHFKSDRRHEGSDRITRTLDIVHYLGVTLDHEKGGDVAANLARLYDFIRDTLCEANIHADADKIHVAINVLQTLLEGWQGIMTKEGEEPASNDAPATDGSVSFRMVG